MSMVQGEKDTKLEVWPLHLDAHYKVKEVPIQIIPYKDIDIIFPGAFSRMSFLQITVKI